MKHERWHTLHIWFDINGDWYEREIVPGYLAPPSILEDFPRYPSPAYTWSGESENACWEHFLSYEWEPEHYTQKVIAEMDLLDKLSRTQNLSKVFS